MFFSKANKSAKPVASASLPPVTKLAYRGARPGFWDPGYTLYNPENDSFLGGWEADIENGNLSAKPRGY